MESERPHRSTSSNSSSTSELFVCFTSRLSSSSMKLSSKSILSPSRSRDPPQISLSSSLSRRLKSNGSIKGGGGGQASPMFPTGGGKRRGCGFDNPEPSSPKVTCIGQVRVKTKKQGKKMRARSKRRGEASFRKTEQGGANPDLTRQNSQSFQFQNHQNLQQECLKHRNQRWVHLPLTICEALREFTCFFPCRSSCMSSEREKEKSGVVVRGSGEGHGREGSCGAAFARWLVALQDGEGKGRGIELVMEEEEEEDEKNDDDGREKTERSYSQRRHVFEDIDIDLVEGKKKHDDDEEFLGGEEEEKARVSICIPPKNALLLMRCRSDPVKMAALANRFWESPVHKDTLGEDHDQNVEDSADEDENQEEKECDINPHIETMVDKEEQVTRETNGDTICEREEVEQDEEEGATTFPEEQEVKESYEIQNHETKDEEEKEQETNENPIDQGEAFSCLALHEPHSDLEKPEQEGVHLQEQKEKENEESSELSSSPETFTASEPQNNEANTKPEDYQEAAEPMAETSEEGSTEEEEEIVNAKQQSPQEPDPTQNPNPESKERENRSKKEERERETLPECLLLMMCEPKLSMEVSKETWVCSTDFIRWLPERPAGKNDGTGVGKRVGVDVLTKPKPKPSAPPTQPLMQPPRSSCSFPAAGGVAGMSMATMIEQKLVGAKSGNGYEPFVLTRCKSEPMRSSAKLAPEACFWNNRKLEPHAPPAQLGVGAPAGVGF
ncbi:hypothetical protein RJT34_29233 [Clitoria ternatea]|uniref:Uncharacterized protein n=1 Tax=Clitoria ternatea TaxID=43366 RepID=A0AAN9ID14_CLITE